MLTARLEDGDDDNDEDQSLNFGEKSIIIKFDFLSSLIYIIFLSQFPRDSNLWQWGATRIEKWDRISKTEVKKRWVRI